MTRVWSGVEITNINRSTERDRAKYSHWHDEIRLLSLNDSLLKQFETNWQKTGSFMSQARGFFGVLWERVPDQHLVCAAAPLSSLAARLLSSLPPRPAAALMECRLLAAHTRHSSLMRKLAGTTWALADVGLMERRVRRLCGFIYSQAFLPSSTLSMSIQSGRARGANQRTITSSAGG